MGRLRRRLIKQLDKARRAFLQGQVIEHKVPRGKGAGVQPIEKFVELVGKGSSVLKCQAAAMVEIGHAGRRDLRLPPDKALRIETPALVPGKDRHPRGKTFLIGDPLALVLAEKNHTGGAAQRRFISRFVVLAVAQLTETQTAPPQFTTDRLKQLRHHDLTLPTKLVVNEKVGGCGC